MLLSTVVKYVGMEAFSGFDPPPPPPPPPPPTTFFMDSLLCLFSSSVGSRSTFVQEDPLPLWTSKGFELTTFTCFPGSTSRATWVPLSTSSAGESDTDR